MQTPTIFPTHSKKPRGFAPLSSEKSTCCNPYGTPIPSLPQKHKQAAAPLAQTDKIVMYGDGNSSKLIKDVMNGANQVMEGIKEATGIDLSAMIGTAGEKNVKTDNEQA